MLARWVTAHEFTDPRCRLIDSRRLLSNRVLWVGVWGLWRGRGVRWLAAVGGQVVAQLVPLWCRPRLVRRWRLTAAARSRSQCWLLASPM